MTQKLATQKSWIRAAAALLLALPFAQGQAPASDPATELKNALQTVQKLADQVAAQEARLRELAAALAGRGPAGQNVARENVSAGADAGAGGPEATANLIPAVLTHAGIGAAKAATIRSLAQPPASEAKPAAAVEPAVAEAPAAEAARAESASLDTDAHDHMVQLPGGGPVLRIRGFTDFNFGGGSIANPLMFPIVANGCPPCGNPATPPHTGFQAGEFDLFMSSKLSDHLSFLAEMVFGADTTNLFGIDIERYQLTYRVNNYFTASAGRFHTAIGYYNTAYHHGNWFSTAEGRPIMYLFEDSGGVLPVHTVGVTFTGLVPKTESLGLHWVAEVGNGRASNPAAAEPSQNFYTDRNYKAFNLALYIKPMWAQGLQIGGSYFHDRLTPPGLAHVDQDIGSAYVVYFNSNWEFMNEAVLLSNRLLGAAFTYRSPMAYTQLARKFGRYRPYIRYQYLNDHVGDPVNILEGLYFGPSVGVRYDFSDYAAFKLQYNRLSKSTPLPAANGLNAQVAFTF